MTLAASRAVSVALGTIQLALLISTSTVVVAQAPEVDVPACVGSAAADRDRDGLSDSCEVALAHAFAPVLTVRSGGCNWDYETGSLGGGYFYAVQPLDSVIRVAYLPAYFRDCGWSGVKCWLPWVDCSPHAGDSEMIAVELQVAGNPARFRATGVFLSAHCFGRSGGSCRWYRGAELQELDWVGAAPMVWVAEGRNANYASWRTCDGGHHSLDTCDDHDVRYYFPIEPHRNIGSRIAPQMSDGCVRGSDLADAALDAAAVECFWRADMPFRGWQVGESGVTPYERYLREIVGI